MVDLLAAYPLRDGPPPHSPSPKCICCVSLLILPEQAAVGFQVDFDGCYMLTCVFPNVL